MAIYVMASSRVVVNEKMRSAPILGNICMDFCISTLTLKLCQREI